MSLRDRINKFRDEWAAAGERLDELNAQRPAPKPPRQLTDEEKQQIANDAVTVANNTINGT